MVLTIYITDKCNMNCSYCYIPTEVRKQNSVPYDLLHNTCVNIIRKIQDEGVKIDTVLFHGAEAGTLTAKELSSLVNIFNVNSIPVTIQTNGYAFGNKEYIQEFVSSLVNKQLVVLSVTLDGPRNVHNKLRGNYDRCALGVRNAVEFGIDVGILMTVTKYTVHNIFKVKEWVDNLYKVGIEVAYQLVVDKYNMFTEVEVKLFKEVMKDYLHNINKVDNCNNLTLQYTGEISSCLENPKEYVFSSIKEPFNYIIDKRVNVKHYSNTDNNDCIGCKHYNVCHTVCPSRLVDGKNSLCEFRKAGL